MALAYLLAAEPQERSLGEPWVGRVRRAMRSLHLVVFVPIESPDRIAVSEEDEGAPSRRAVDRALRGLLEGDALDLGVEVLEVRGSAAERADWLLRRLGELSDAG